MSMTRNDMHIPTLRSVQPNPEEYAGSTCFEAGYLVSKNAGWRNVRPVIDADACTGCLQCYMYCPDGTIRKTSSGTPSSSCGSALRGEARDGVPSRESGAPDDVPALSGTPSSAAVFVDYDFCKGCGICAQVCSFSAITMIPESEA